ncbi:sensor histidine kinase [Candidatus Omnitrophota bacterium]
MDIQGCPLKPKKKVMMVRRFKLTPYLGVFFIIVVIVPGVLLSLLALRSISHEEAYIEKKLEDALQTEVIHVAHLIDAELQRIQQDLLISASRIDLGHIETSFSQWQSSSLLVEVPFLLSANQQVIWPAMDKISAERERQFIAQQQEFLENRVKIPVYEDIAVAYKDDIVQTDTEQPQWFSRIRPSQRTVMHQGGATRTTAVTADQGLFGVQSSQTIDQERLQEQQTVDALFGEQYATQQAKTEFATNAPVRKKVYDLAKTQGQQTYTRNVMPQKGFTKSIALLPKKKAVTKEREILQSVFISEPLNFRQIVAKGQNGIIPRFIDDTLRLIFWRKDTSGMIVGCLIEDRELKNRILGLLPDIYSTTRIITVLDENSWPLIIPNLKTMRNWRTPFVAREISELLPRWEVVAYLTDPNIVASRAQYAATYMWILIFIMFASIVMGGTLVLRSVYAEMKLAQQKSTFVANVSHELKTPLTSIRMFAEMLREGRQSDEGKQKSYLRIMSSEADRLTNLINNVLDFSRMEQGKKRYTMKPYDIVALCREMMESQRDRLENNGFTVRFQSEIKQLVLTIDEEALKQAVVNLFSNAEKYSTDTKKVEISVQRNNHLAAIIISDRGVGVPQDAVGKIFSEFYRADDSLTSRVRGSGLGLTIAQRIARDHGGDLVYKPREGGGSIFQIILPIIEEKT